jgi:predicted DNA-binding helix-hairpin-helix protein
MLINTQPDTTEKLRLLSRDSQYDLACACGSTKDSHRSRGNHGKWIYPITLPNGGKSVLFKTLISNVCSSDCKYCPLNKNSNVQRCTLNSDEIVNTFLDYYNNREVFGLFLSSGLLGTADATMDRLIAAAEILRKRHQFKGYIHLKILPGASPAAIEKAVSLASAVSLNIETPGREFMSKLSSQKDFNRDIVEPMKLISKLAKDPRRKVKQTTQFIVGAAGENDRQIVNYTAAMYDKIGLERVYFSAYQNLNAPHEPSPTTHTPTHTPSAVLPSQDGFIREHRLYQVDFLLRKYNFSQSDIIYDENGLLSKELDPKELWAKKHPEFFPVNINTADRYELLRVPGLGPNTVNDILHKRKFAKISSIDDINYGRRLLKASKYLDFGCQVKNKVFLFNF